ncbi:hypothetical protein [Pedobacter sp. V48]|uniref:hypothetical protein n=1 Tax=Pedobacter sp. V48 TaxID=509635 RepID=UPI0003E4AF61|nr:hypothetical protein [Pedobacter sp. V48]ETZ24885.1 hypothetical protein N824_01250 [Pedobacter sp. V48]
MKFSVYVIYELLMKVQELESEIGDYQSYRKINAGISVITTRDSFDIPAYLLDKQFNNPALISDDDILGLLTTYKPKLPL